MNNANGGKMSVPPCYGLVLILIMKKQADLVEFPFDCRWKKKNAALIESAVFVFI